MSSPLRVNNTSGTAFGLEILTNTRAVDTFAERGTTILAPAFCLKTIREVTVSGNTLLAARLVVFPESAGIKAANLAQILRDCRAGIFSTPPISNGVSD